MTDANHRTALPHPIVSLGPQARVAQSSLLAPGTVEVDATFAERLASVHS
ncbi:MAG: hypothetical protein Q8L48_00540 [Archangium sp.]|nr:hypothetical protein [Archangium sp.]